MPSQAERRAAAEDALLAAAAELIAEDGVERTSLRSIGARAGISRAMPAYHFGTKDALIARIVERGHEQTLAAAAAALEAAGPRVSRLDLLRLVIESFLAHFGSATGVEERAVVVMWGATFPANAGLSAMVESDRVTHGLIADLVREGQTEGSVRLDVEPAAAAMLIMGMARGAAAVSLTHAEAADADDVRRLAGETIVASLRRG